MDKTRILLALLISWMLIYFPLQTWAQGQNCGDQIPVLSCPQDSILCVVHASEAVSISVSSDLPDLEFLIVDQNIPAFNGSGPAPSRPAAQRLGGARRQVEALGTPPAGLVFGLREPRFRRLRPDRSRAALLSMDRYPARRVSAGSTRSFIVFRTVPGPASRVVASGASSWGEPCSRSSSASS